MAKAEATSKDMSMKDILRSITDSVVEDEFFKQVDDAMSIWASEQMVQDMADSPSGGDDAMSDNMINSINLIEMACNVISVPLRPAKVHENDVYLQVLRSASAMGFPHVAEIYSPPRVTSLADQFG